MTIRVRVQDPDRRAECSPARTAGSARVGARELDLEDARIHVIGVRFSELALLMLENAGYAGYAFAAPGEHRDAVRVRRADCVRGPNGVNTVCEIVVAGGAAG